MRILFVCLGNICRSPTAEGVLRGLAITEKFPGITQIDSAGTANYHCGDAPDPRSQRAALARGYDLSLLRARQLSDADMTRFDLILAMDRANLADIQRRARVADRHKVQLFWSTCRDRPSWRYPIRTTAERTASRLSWIFAKQPGEA